MNSVNCTTAVNINQGAFLKYININSSINTFAYIHDNATEYLAQPSAATQKAEASPLKTCLPKWQRRQEGD